MAILALFAKKKKNQLYIYTRGHNISCNKDGSNKIDFGPRFCLKKELVDTVDCQCLIVHSDLIKKYHLRFDEHLQFHFYAEEFCIMASEKYNIPSYALSIDSIHYSFGTINEAFHDAVSYVKSKYSNCSHPYSAICDNTIIGNVNTIGYPKKEFWKYFLYQRKITKSGKEVIKIFKIPVCSKKNI